jgi:hypothetical protein
MTGGTKIVPNPCHDRQLKPRGFIGNWTNSKANKLITARMGQVKTKGRDGEDPQTGPGARDAC